MGQHKTLLLQTRPSKMRWIWCSPYRTWRTHFSNFRKSSPNLLYHHYRMESECTSCLWSAYSSEIRFCYIQYIYTYIYIYIYIIVKTCSTTLVTRCIICYTKKRCSPPTWGDHVLYIHWCLFTEHALDRTEDAVIRRHFSLLADNIPGQIVLDFLLEENVINWRDHGRIHALSTQYEMGYAILMSVLHHPKGYSTLLKALDSHLSGGDWLAETLRNYMKELAQENEKGHLED